MTISIQDDTSAPLDPESLRLAVEEGLRLEGEDPSGEVVVQVVTADTICQLNAEFRGCDEVTDVLTFPADPLPGVPAAMQPLGTIVICRDEVERAVRSHATSLQEEVEILAVHGSLHLIGYEDEDLASQAEMRAAMEQVFAKLGRPLRPHWESLPHVEAQ